MLAKNDAVAILKSTLASNRTLMHDEQIAESALAALEHLALDEATVGELKRDKQLISLLQALQSDAATKTARRFASGCLFALEGSKERSAVVDPKASGGWVMISYNWVSQCVSGGALD